MTAIGSAQYLTEIDVRIAMRDLVPEDNALLDAVEFTPEEIRSAQTLAVDLYNETPPIIETYDYTEFPYRYHLLQGTIANLLFIAAHHYRRNDLTYSIPGGAVAPKDKGPAYDAVGQRLLAEYKQWVEKIKIVANVNAGWGTIG